MPEGMMKEDDKREIPGADARKAGKKTQAHRF